MRASDLISRFVGRSALIRIDSATWHALFDELSARGGGVRESGAFLLGSKEDPRPRVREIIYFDDLDEDALTGAIHLHAYAFARLWRICRQGNMRVLADVHTHPSAWVQQSTIDQANPMVAREGHLGLIVPEFARGSRSARAVGFHIYRGESGWDSHYGTGASRLLYVGAHA